LNPKGYDGKTVAVVGFLAIDNGAVVIYPDKYSYEARLYANGRLAVVADADKKLAWFERYGYKHVLVTGNFSTDSYRGGYSTVTGRISVVELSLWSGVTRREGPSDLAIEVD